ncbi:hypothetical protein BCR33DRAFT_790721 [Rhizoclosmatium globosum]|uniref:Uncharacterized protein n=1 Tax=Rhizoclosmatium globosum TaxID=329046 RepID=A0A1Y2BK53_9FUNG|nr:hypothetical protein BCR33DRAFT_790721 [Rhizoclosmatium globosum]|eukprot:ORY35161.1 hypothetical protein BCR33DRAFT_790721 [Rhizoclosmatium globosum]
MTLVDDKAESTVSSKSDQIVIDANENLQSFLYGTSTSISQLYPIIPRKPRLQCGGLSNSTLTELRGLNTFWTLESHDNAFIIRPSNASLLPCTFLSLAVFSVWLDGDVFDPSEPRFHLPLKFAKRNDEVPGLFTLHAGLKNGECLPAQKFQVNAQLEYHSLPPTPEVSEYGTREINAVKSLSERVVVNLSPSPFPAASLDLTKYKCPRKSTKKFPCTAQQLESLTVYRYNNKLKPLGCTVPIYTQFKDIQLLSDRKSYTSDQWIHFVGDFTTRKLFLKLAEKVGLTPISEKCHQTDSKHGVIICFRDPLYVEKRADMDVTVLVFTPWSLQSNDTTPLNAMEGQKFRQIMDLDMYWKVLPKLWSKKQKRIIFTRTKALGLPLRTVIALGSEYPEQTYYGRKEALKSIFRRVYPTTHLNHYKSSTMFIGETASVPSQIPDTKKPFMNNRRVMERNQAVLEVCREYGFQYLDLFGWGAAWNEEAELHGTAYSRMADTVLYNLIDN